MDTHPNDTRPNGTAPPLELSSALAAAEHQAAELRARGAWSDADDADLAARFEAAAQQALRVPALAERSATLRGLARRFVPPLARPLLRRAAFAGDELLRAVFERIERRVDRGRTV